MATTRILTDSLGQYFLVPPGCEFAEPERELTLQKVGETIVMFPTPRTRDDVLAVLVDMPEPFQAITRANFAKLLRRGWLRRMVLRAFRG
ncbi:MAG: hypothetical protein P4M15_07350 [Alphaproteobacteria bacterium]|nr:hypothetical protein [Alphaproteobacteria bacterium]